ncbi:rod shape-determining protein MreD [Waterburya agarophytonicola K14]|uniref:Rod shape-determining protein MreD n=1 Tax=Waterburya agarophytonicola KI4 TaxID=2874699 RepID=A0A964BT31_9CYAN|nr:rod shape-determining protein MreD [Waterburya agarophytonicola]MCC0178965.1 rod shape-determining protein MreD [Waterburya agarophytonicola KI4]
MPHQFQRSIDIFKIFNLVFIVFSFIICVLLMFIPIPGMELLGTSPNWLFIWLIAWSIKQPVWSSAIAGLIVAWVYDGITLATPDHVFGFVIVGVCVAGLQKQKYTGEDFISVAFIVFFMTIVSETVFALHYLRIHWLSVSEVLPKYQETAIISAIITSLWSPVFYYPFNLCQQKIKQLERKVLK